MPVSHCHHLLVGDWNQLPCEVFQEAASKTAGGKPGNDGEENSEEVGSQTMEQDCSDSLDTTLGLTT